VWNDRLELIKSKPIGTVAEREKMPFEVTPFLPYLVRYGTRQQADERQLHGHELYGCEFYSTKPPETASIPATDPKPAEPPNLTESTEC